MLAPNPDLIKELLTNLYVAQQSVTVAAFSLQHTLLYPPDPIPAWYNTLQTGLTTVQGTANDWLITNGPQVIASLPQQLIGYSSRFGAFARAAQAADLPTLQHEVAWLKTFVKNFPTQATALQQQITQLATTFSAQKQMLQTGITAAGQDLQGDQQKVKDLQEQISQLYQKISTQTADAKNEMTGMASSGASMSFALLAYGFSVATAAGPAFPFIGLGVALFGLTYNAIMNAINERKIVDELTQIGKLQVELTKEEQQIAALQAIQSALQVTEDAVQSIQSSLDLAPIWQDVNNQLDTLAQLLQQSGVDYHHLDQILTLPDAATAWQQIATMATNVQRAAAGLTQSWTVDLNRLPQPGN